MESEPMQLSYIWNLNFSMVATVYPYKTFFILNFIYSFNIIVGFIETISLLVDPFKLFIKPEYSTNASKKRNS